MRPPGREQAARAQEGVAYLMAILLLFLFTMLALSLNLAMQSELLSAAHPRLVARMLYAAESGVGAAVARALASGETGPVVLRRLHRESEEGALVLVEERLEIGGVVALGAAPCDYCSVETRDAWSEQTWAVSVRAWRGAPGIVEGDRGRSFAAASAEAEIRVSPLPFRSGCAARRSGMGEVFSDSSVLMARLRVASVGSEDPELRCVAVVAGGSSVPEDSEPPALLILEPGSEEPLVRIELDGAPMTAPTGADRDLDGVLDGIYVGTAAGSLYRVDVRPPIVVSSDRFSRLPEGWSVELVLRIPGRPVVVRPSTFFVEAVNGLGLVAAFGPRDTETPGLSAADRPLLAVVLDGGSARLEGGSREEDYRALAWGDRLGRRNLLLGVPDGRRPGWILSLEQNERVTGPALLISGLLSFDVRLTDRSEAADICERGLGRIYRLRVTNADPADGESRSRPMEGCMTRALGLPPWEPEPRFLGAFSQPEYRDELLRIEATRTASAPERCRFGAFFVHAIAERSTGDPFPLARIPVCVSVSSWPEI